MTIENLTIRARAVVTVLAVLLQLLIGACASTPSEVQRSFAAARAAWAVAQPFADAVVDAALADGSVTADQAAAFKQGEQVVADALAQSTVTDAAVAAWKSVEPVALQQLDRLVASGRLTPSQASRSRLGLLAFGAALQILASELAPAPIAPPAG